MECHKCEQLAAVEAGKFNGVAFEETPCARCDGMARESYPLQYQEIAAENEPAVAGTSVPELAFPEEDQEAVLPMSVLVSTMAAFLSLPDSELRLLCLRYQGLSNVQIGQALGVSTGAVKMRFIRALNRWPQLTSLFIQTPVRQQCQKRGRVVRRRALAG